MFGDTNSLAPVVDVVLTTYEYLSKYTHEQLSQFTYDRLRNRFVPEDNNKEGSDG